MEQGCCEGSSAKGWTSSRYSVPPGFLGSCAFAMAQRACPAWTQLCPWGAWAPAATHPHSAAGGVSPALGPPGCWAVIQERSSAGRQQDRQCTSLLPARSTCPASVPSSSWAEGPEALTGSRQVLEEVVLQAVRVAWWWLLIPKAPLGWLSHAVLCREKGRVRCCGVPQSRG